MKFKSKFITTEDFKNLPVIDVFKREYDEREIPDSPIKNYHIHIRKAFNLASIQRTRIRITADDYYKLYVNGRFVGQGPAPAYPECYNYNDIDITDYLTVGKNVIAVHVYYQGQVNRVYVSGDNRMGLIADIFTEDNYLFGTDESWVFRVVDDRSGDSVGYDTAYLENIDFSKTERGWYNVDFDDSAYKNMIVKTDADYIYKDEPMWLVDVYNIKPTVVKKISDGKYFVDFGKEITGQFFMTAKGEVGQRVRVLCGEELIDGEDDLVRYEMRCNCNYDEMHTLSGNIDVLDYFDYKSFRYVNIFTDIDNLDEKSFGATVRHHRFDPKYTLESSLPYLKDIWDICENSLRIGAQGGMLDCPSREKGAYLGDFTVSGLAHLYMTDDSKYYKKQLYDFAATARIDEGIMACATCSLMQEIADFSLQYPMQLLNYYRFTTDKEVLTDLYPLAYGIVKSFDIYKRHDGLLSDVYGKWNLVDWPENLRDGYDAYIPRAERGHECHNVINAFYICAMDTVNKIAEIIGKDKPFRTDDIKQAYIGAFYNEKIGLFCDSERKNHSALHSNVLPLCFGITTDEMVDDIHAFIMKKGLSCGVQFSYFVLKALSRIGAYEDELALILNESEHSWVNMIREGASCTFEAWGKDQKWNTSLCHPWASAPIIAIFEDLNGKFGINLIKK